MALRGGNALNKGSARKSAKFVKPKAKAKAKAVKNAQFAKVSRKTQANKARSKAKHGTVRRKK